MAKSDIQTMLYLSPAIRGWLEARARFENDSMNGVIRHVLRDHIQRVDPAGWTKVEAALRAEAEINEDQSASGS